MHVSSISNINQMTMIMAAFALVIVTQSDVVESADLKGEALHIPQSPVSVGPPPLGTPTSVQHDSAFDGVVASPTARNRTHCLETRIEWLENQLEIRNVIIQEKDVEIASLKARYAVIVMDREAEIARLRAWLSSRPPIAASITPSMKNGGNTAYTHNLEQRANGGFTRQYKTQLCREYMKGLTGKKGTRGCLFAHRCIFAHGESELRRSLNYNS